MAHDEEPGGAGALSHGSVITAAPATTAFIALNLAVYAVMVARGQNGLAADARVLVDAGGNFEPLVLAGQWWRLLTSAFLHGGLLHIALNMLGLWSGGPLLEEAVGTSRYAAIYVLTALGAALSSLLIGPAAVSVGASGAVFGVYGALLALALRHTPRGERWRALTAFARIRHADRNPQPEAADGGHGDVFLTPQLARRLASQIAALFVFNLLVGFTIPGIDNAAHVGGFACGIGLGWLSGAPATGRRMVLIPLMTGAAAFLLAGSAVWPHVPSQFRLRAYDAACRGGATPACMAAGREADRSGTPAGRQLALTYFERGCRAGSREACGTLGHARLAGGDAGRRAAVAPLTSACSAGDPRSCASLALMYERGLGVDQDSARAARWLARACEQSDPASCLRLGEAYRTGHGTPTNAGKAAAAFSRACDLGVAAACERYADALAAGAGVAHDPGLAASVYRRACLGGRPAACARGGTLMEQGHDAGAVEPHAAAAALYERGCALRDAASCFNLGALYDAGRGRPKDAARARALYRQACALGMRQVCGLLALWDAHETKN